MNTNIKIAYARYFYTNNVYIKNIWFRIFCYTRDIYIKNFCVGHIYTKNIYFGGIYIRDNFI